MNVTTHTGELLPHLFTLTPAQVPGRFFSVTLLCLHKQFPVRKYGALRCPDFPPFHQGTATNRPTILFAKIDIIFYICLKVYAVLCQTLTEVRKFN